MAEEFDDVRLPSNPRLMELFRTFCIRQKAFIQATKWPPGTKFECIKCGDCCTWNFCNFVPSEAMVERLHFYGGKYPHGVWLLLGDRLKIIMPYQRKPEDLDELGEFSFSGLMPPNHIIFLRETGRRHGYWVLNQNNRIIIYSPMPCIHLTNNLCGIYEKRPHICTMYLCNRYPIIGDIK